MHFATTFRVWNTPIQLFCKNSLRIFIQYIIFPNFCTPLFLRYEKSYRLHKNLFYDFSTFTALYSFLYSFIPFFTFLCRFVDIFLSQTFKDLRWAKRWINTCLWSKSFCMSTNTLSSKSFCLSANLTYVPLNCS